MASLLLATALTACSTEEPDSGAGSDTSGSSATGTSDPTADSGTSSSDPSPSSSPYLDVPEGVELTEPGTQLALGDQATVAYQPRQKQVGVLDITVTGIERTTFAASFEGWEIDDAAGSKTPYFVRATVTNTGDTDLGGRPVPLYAATDANTLIESSTFSHEFRPCRPGTLPDPFAPKATVDVCLVYLLPEKTRLTAVTFRPTEEFLPITWSGQIAQPGKAGARQSPSPTPVPSASATP